MNTKNYLSIINGLSNLIFYMILVLMCDSTGAGLFVCAFLIYKMLFIIFAGGLRTTLAHAISNRRSKGMYEGAKKYYEITMRYALVCGIVIGLWLFGLSNITSSIIYGNNASGALVRYFGIYFLLHTVCDVLSGYHIGNNNGSVVFIGEIVYAVLSCILCPVMIKAMTGYGNKVADLLKAPVMLNTYRAQGAVIAMCISTFVMMVILLTGSRGFISRSRSSLSEGRNDVRFSYSAYILGACIESLKVKSFPYVVYFLYIVIYMRSINVAGLETVALYSNVGNFATGIFVLIFLQECILGEYIVAYRNKLKTDFKKDEIKNFTAALNMMLKNIILLVLPFACSVMCYCKGISNVIYHNNAEDGYKLVIVAGVCLIFAGIDRGFRAVLAASGYSNAILLGNVVGVLSASLYGFLVAGPELTAAKLGIGFIIYFVCLCIIHAITVFRHMTIRYNDILARLAVASIASIVLVILDVILARFLNMNLMILIICYLCGYVIYIVSLLALHGVNGRDIRSLKGTIIYYPLDFVGGLFGIR